MTNTNIYIMVSAIMLLFMSMIWSKSGYTNWFFKLLFLCVGIAGIVIFVKA